MEIVNKESIFKQATYRKLYSFKTTIEEDCFSSRKRLVKSNFIEEYELIKNEVIHACNLELPALDKGEKFYVKELDKTLIIKDRVINSDGSYMYECEDVYIDDEKSLETKRKAEKEKQQYLDKTDLDTRLKRVIELTYKKECEKEQLESQLAKIGNHWLIGRLIKIFKLND